MNNNTPVVSDRADDLFKELLDEARTLTRTHLYERERAHLLYILQTFARGRKLTYPLGQLFAKGVFDSNVELIVNVADTSLVLLGFFPTYIQHKSFSEKYVTDVGQGAYRTIGEKLFADNLPRLARILRTIYIMQRKESLLPHELLAFSQAGNHYATRLLREQQVYVFKH